MSRDEMGGGGPAGVPSLAVALLLLEKGLEKLKRLLLVVPEDETVDAGLFWAV